MKEERQSNVELQKDPERACGVDQQSLGPLHFLWERKLVAGLFTLALLVLPNSMVVLSQQHLEPIQVDTVGSAATTPQSMNPSPATSQVVRSAYILGPDDVITVQVMDVDEFKDAKPIRVDGDGKINLPLVGNLSVSGLTLSRAESDITTKLKTYVHDPQVIVQVSQFRSQPVSVLGHVNKPGIQEIQGPRTLMEVISLAGGLSPDGAGKVKITRPVQMGNIPLPSTTLDPTGKFNTAEVDIKAIMNSENLTENIPILPHDVITVPKAPIVYVLGAVKRSGGFVLGDKETITVMQAVSLSEGWIPLSAPNKAKVLRLSKANERTEIAMDLKALLEGKLPDMPMQPEDILYVPDSQSKRIWAKIGTTALSITSGVVIYSTRY